jgi:hypothetical protein
MKSKEKDSVVKLCLRPHSGGLDSLSQQPSHIIDLNIHPELLCIFHEFFSKQHHICDDGMDVYSVRGLCIISITCEMHKSDSFERVPKPAS